MTGLFQTITRRAGWILLLGSATVLLALSQIIDLRTGERYLEIDPSLNRLLPEEDPTKKFYDRVRRVFGSDESLVVALSADDVFRREHLESVIRMTRRIEQIDGIHHVVSLANALNIRAVGDDLAIEPFVTRVPDSDAELARIRREALDNPIYAGNLVTRDGTATALLVYLHDFSDRELVERRIDEKILEAAEAERGTAQVWVTGLPRIKAVTARIMLRELVVISPLILAVLGGVLAFSFRSLHGVVVPLVSIAFALLWTLGFATSLGYALNAVTTIVPPLLLTLGLAYSVHVVSETDALRRERADGTPIEWVSEGLRQVALPVALTGFTTAAGFLSLMLSPIGAIREFGLLAVVGVVFTVLASLTITPALIVLIGPRRSTAGPEQKGLFDRFAERVALFDASHSRLIFAASIALVLVSVWGATQIRFGTDHTSKFEPDAPVRVHFEAVNEHLEGANPFYVIVRAVYADAFKDPVNLQAIQELQVWLAEQPEIGGTTSLVDYIKLINRGFHENSPDHLVVPDSRRLVSQLLFFGANEEIERFVDSRYQMVSIAVRAKVIDSDDLETLIETVEKRLEALPDHLEATVTGNPVLINATLGAIMRGQMWSLASAMLIIYVLLSFLFTSPRVGFIALLPNLFPIAIYFGALGIAGVSLNPGTSLIAPMVIGIAVDDTIHYFARFNREARVLADDRRAVVTALRAVGRPVTYTSIALVLGFLMLNTSELRTNGEIGNMAALALGFAWAADFFLTPALCAGLRVATLWDVLTLDLGKEPQKSIPLLAGLSNAQARIVALMTDIIEVPAGHRLIRAGETGEEMYIVLDGELQASVDGKEGRRLLLTMSRGAPIGQVGLFYAKRTADVDVTENARLLRLTGDSLDRLRRRYPKVAAQVHRNLNEDLAGMVARMTDRLR